MLYWILVATLMYRSPLQLTVLWKLPTLFCKGLMSHFTCLVSFSYQYMFLTPLSNLYLCKMIIFVVSLFETLGVWFGLLDVGFFLFVCFGVSLVRNGIHSYSFLCNVLRQLNQSFHLAGIQKSFMSHIRN